MFFCFVLRCPLEKSADFTLLYATATSTYDNNPLATNSQLCCFSKPSLLISLEGGMDVGATELYCGSSAANAGMIGRFALPSDLMSAWHRL